MKTPLIGALIAVMVVSGCSTVRESRFNPFNWFGNSREEAATLEPREGYIAVRDGRGMVDSVVSLRIDRTPEGALISAVGLPPTQGYWQAELVPVDQFERPENGTLAYEFRIAKPFGQARVSTQQSREVSVGHFVSNTQLQNVRTITVIGKNNRRSSRR